MLRDGSHQTRTAFPFSAPLRLGCAGAMLAAVLGFSEADRAFAADTSALRINEILSDNLNTPPTDVEAQYEDMVEIYNPTAESISIKDLLLANAVTKDAEGKILPVTPWRIPAGSINPNGFVLVYCDGDVGSGGSKEPHTPFRLDRNGDGEVIALFKPDLTLIDMVILPRIPEGISFGRLPDGGDTFCYMPAPSFKNCSVLFGGCLTAQNKPCSNLPPEVNLRAYRSIENAGSINPPAGTAVALEAESWDEKEEGVKRVVVRYQVDAQPVVELALTWESFLFKPDPFGPVNPADPPPPPLVDKTRSVWKGSLPGQPAGSVVTFTLLAEDVDGATATDPKEICTGTPTANCKPPFRYRVAYEYGGTLALNEMVPLNLTIIKDITDNRNDDYIELCSSADVSLEGIWLSDNPFQPQGWSFPLGSHIKAGEHLLIWADDDERLTRPEIGQYHTNFNLNNEGETVFLFDTEANGLGFIDGFKWGLVDADVALSRDPDCSRSGDFKNVKGGSPGKANSVGPILRSFIRADADLNGLLDLSDPVFTLNALFLGGPQPDCSDAADADDTGSVDISDPIFSLNYQFLGGPPPPAPYPNAGLDGTSDPLVDCVLP